MGFICEIKQKQKKKPQKLHHRTALRTEFFSTEESELQ